MKIYIVQEVSVDYYELKEILYASNSITKINKYLYSEQFKKDVYNHENIPIIWDSNENIEDLVHYIFIEEIEDEFND